MEMKYVAFVVVVAGMAFEVAADTHYVDLNNATPLAPYTNWTDAATSIQDAVDAASSNDTVLVADGVYSLSSQLMVNKDITIQSENGSEFTIVDGGNTVRCFHLGGNACVIRGFTIRNGRFDGPGGGVYCSSTTPELSECIIINNICANPPPTPESVDGETIGVTAISDRQGGGMYGGTANYCTFSGNESRWGGGLYGGIANYCTRGLTR